MERVTLAMNTGYVHAGTLSTWHNGRSCYAAATDPPGRIDVTPNRPQAPSQSSTLNPPIRRNSRRLWLTSVTSKASAWPASWRS